MHQTQTKQTNASHERYEKRTIHETNAQYTNERNETNALCSIEVQYSIVLLFE